MHNYSPLVAHLSKYFTILMAIKVLIQMPYEWLYNPTIKQNTGKRYKNIKRSSHNHSQHLLLYKLVEELSSGLGGFYSAGSVTY